MKRWISRYHAVAAGLGAAILLACAATPSLAQGLAQAPMAGGDASTMGGSDETGYIGSIGRVPIRNVLPTRVNSTLERRAYAAADLERRRTEMSDSEIRADISEQLEIAGVSCGVRGHKRVGTTPEAQSIYEAACDSGPGYMLVNGLEPSATSCLVLAGGATNAARRDPNAAVGAQCTLAENQNGLQVIGGWARAAGVACRIDQAEWLGPSEGGFDVYEVGCAGTEGFWLENAGSGWSLKGCLEIRAEGLNCRYTDPSEQHAWMRARLSGTSAEACDVAEVRMVGVSPQGRHYEARCNAPGEGFLVRIAGDGPAEDVVSCVEAEDRAVGCAMGGPYAAIPESGTRRQA